MGTALVGAHLTGLGRINRQSVEVVDLDLEYGQIGCKPRQGVIEPSRFRPRPQGIPGGVSGDWPSTTLAPQENSEMLQNNASGFSLAFS